MFSFNNDCIINFLRNNNIKDLVDRSRFSIVEIRKMASAFVKNLTITHTALKIMIDDQVSFYFIFSQTAYVEKYGRIDCDGIKVKFNQYSPKSRVFSGMLITDLPYADTIYYSEERTVSLCKKTKNEDLYGIFSSVAYGLRSNKLILHSIYDGDDRPNSDDNAYMIDILKKIINKFGYKYQEKCKKIKSTN